MYKGHKFTSRFFVFLAILLPLAALSCNDEGDRAEGPPEFAQRVIDMVESGDVEGLAAVSAMQERACAAAIEGSPTCHPGDAVGTVYNVFLSSACQGYWTDNIPAEMQAVIDWAGTPYAVARLGAEPDWARQSNVPYGKYIIIFAASGPEAAQAVALHVDDNAILSGQIGCRRADQFLEPGVGEEAPEVIWRPE